MNRRPSSVVALVVLLTACGARTAVDVDRVDGGGSVPTDASPAPIVQLVAGYGFTCALESSGSVRCWGFNESGALGDGTTVSRAEPRPVLGLDDAVSLSAADHRVCALRRDGRIVCWGSRHEGSERRLALTPQPETALAGARVLAVHAYHSCAVDAEAQLWCWGQGAAGELGGGVRPFTPTPVRVAGLEGVVSVAVGESFSCAIDRTRAVSCWGAPRWGAGSAPSPEMLIREPTLVPGTEGATTLAAGYTHACMLGSRGPVRCWGQNLHGAAGADPMSSYVYEPTIVNGLGHVAQIDRGISQGCARERDGRVGCWGSNSFGQLGAEGDDSARAVWVTGLDDAVEIASGEYHNCALRSGGEVACWGDGALGQLGPRMPSGRSSTPVVVIPAP